jgi:hypothetical protein
MASSCGSGAPPKIRGQSFGPPMIVTGLGYPVVPCGAARLRFQVSRSHTPEQLEAAARVLRVVLMVARPAP